VVVGTRASNRPTGSIARPRPSGSYETGFLPDDSNDRQWVIPNVLGVAASQD
jgi:hypothetical protein